MACCLEEENIEMKNRNNDRIKMVLSLLLVSGLFVPSCYDHRKENDDKTGISLDTSGPDTDAPAIDLSKEQDPKDDGSEGGGKDGPCDECPVNSGYPCPCNANCEDGTLCDRVQGGSDYGICMKECTGADEDECALDMGCGAEPACTLSKGDGISYCGLVCTHDGDCPPNMGCTFDPGIGICVIDLGGSDGDTDADTDADTDTDTDTDTAPECAYDCLTGIDFVVCSIVGTAHEEMTCTKDDHHCCDITGSAGDIDAGLTDAGMDAGDDSGK